MMNKKINILIVLISFLFAQNSLLSLHGFGEYLSTYDASSLSLGESRLFSTNFNGLTLTSSSSLSNFNSSHLAMTVAFNEYNAQKLDKVNSNIIHFLSYTFPVSKKSVFSLGMNPLFRTNVSIQEPSFQIFGADQSPIDTDNDGTNDPVAYNTNYKFSGGISEFHGSFSSMIGNNFNLGLRFSKIFGSSKRSSDLRFYEINYNQNGQIQDYELYSIQNSINNYEYSSYNYTLDFRFSIPIIKINNEFVLIYGKSQKMNVEIDFNESSDKQSFSSLNQMLNRGFGFKFNLLNNLGLIFEVNDIESYKSDPLLNIFNNDFPDIFSGHFGIFSKINNPNNTSSDGFDLRAGICFKKYYLDDKDIIDLGITFGFGLNYLKNNSLNLGFKFGERKSDFYNLHDEKYFKLYITLISAEEWFIKKRK